MLWFSEMFFCEIVSLPCWNQPLLRTRHHLWQYLFTCHCSCFCNLGMIIYWWTGMWFCKGHGRLFLFSNGGGVGSSSFCWPWKSAVCRSAENSRSLWRATRFKYQMSWWPRTLSVYFDFHFHSISPCCQPAFALACMHWPAMAGLEWCGVHQT